MSNEETALVERLPNPIEISDGGVVLRNMDDVWGYARGIINAGIHPKSLDTVDKVAIAILTGAEVGWKPMLSVRSLSVINGVPAWVTSAARALVQESGQLKPGTSIQEGVIHADGCQHEKEGKRCVDDCYGYCRTHHKDHATPREFKFTVADAKQAKLWGKPGPWQEYPTRMLMHRAAGFHFRDCWGNVLNGLDVAEAVADYPPGAFVREGESVATYRDPPGRDPLLPREGGEVTDIKMEEGAGPQASDTPDDSEAPAPSADHGLVVEDEPGLSDEEIDRLVERAEQPQPEDEIICARVGCGIVINPGTDVRWKTANGWRCADCGPEDRK